MKNNHHLFTSKYAHEFKVTPLLEVIANLDINDIEKQFKADMYNWMCLELDQCMNVVSLDLLKRYAKGYINQGIVIFENYYIMEVGFWLYKQSVLYEIEQLEINNKLNGELISKAKRYKDYLNQNDKHFTNLDEMIRLLTLGNGKKNFLELSQLTIKKPLIDVQLLNKSQKALFYYLDRSHLYELLYPNDYEMYIDDDFRPYTEFDFEYYKNPPMYSEYPKEKKAYLKFLKSWFLESLESRRKLLGWDEVPNAYQNLMDYANDLLSVVEIAKSPEFIDPLQMLPAPMPTEAPEYPAHIFKSFQAYRLFQTFMEVYKTPVQISFLFRMMAEMESPPLIHVKDTPFREWFNEEDYQLKLHEHTKTFTNAKNADRIDGYSIVKNLIFS